MDIDHFGYALMWMWKMGVYIIFRSISAISKKNQSPGRCIPGPGHFFSRPTRPAGPPGPPRSPHPRELCPRSRGPRPSEVGWSWCRPGRFLEDHPMVVTVEELVHWM